MTSHTNLNAIIFITMSKCTLDLSFCVSKFTLSKKISFYKEREGWRHACASTESFRISGVLLSGRECVQGTLHSESQGKIKAAREGPQVGPVAGADGWSKTGPNRQQKVDLVDHVSDQDGQGDAFHWDGLHF